MKKALFLSLIGMFLYVSCDEGLPDDRYHENPGRGYLKKYPGDLAVEWAKLQMKISRTTAGFGVPPATRAFAYSGLTLYESIVEGIPGYKSVASHLIGCKVQPQNQFGHIFYPASANAAMALIIGNLLPAGSTASLARIDSLESVFNAQFAQMLPAALLERSAAYGRHVATTIFDWSKTDGVAEAAAKNNSYIIPTGTGLWKPTPPGLFFPVNVYAGDVRTFVKNSPALTAPPPPIPYSTEPTSAFYKQVNDVYNISQSLTEYDIKTVKTWGEFPGNYLQTLRYQQIAIQLIDDSNITLDLAALAFAKHGMAIQEAVACVFKAKYIHNVVRPITYIHEVLLETTWVTVNTTPPHPEYPSAHSTVGRASSRVLESIFGTHYGFTDRTHESAYGARFYKNLKAYSDEGGLSRILGGIHYTKSVEAGSQQGEKVGNLINQLPFKNGNGHY